MPRIPIAFANGDAILNYWFDIIIDVPPLAELPEAHVIDASNQSAAIIERNVATLIDGQQSTGSWQVNVPVRWSTIKGLFGHDRKIDSQLINRYHKAGNKDKSA